MLQRAVAVLFFAGLALAEDCGTHLEGEMYAVSECSSFYYQCIHGTQQKQPCAPGTVFDPATKTFVFSSKLSTCSSVVDCKDKNGDPVNGLLYTKSADCNDGVFYECENGAEKQKQCVAGLIFDPAMRNCNWKFNVDDCTTTSIDSDSDAPEVPSPTTTTTEKVTTTTATSTTTSIEAVDCGTHFDGELYSSEDCAPYYYQCVNGAQMKRECAGGTVFDPASKTCTFRSEVAGCSGTDIIDCKDANGNQVNGEAYTKKEDCNDGKYYKCENGVEVQHTCAADMIFDTITRNCNWKYNVADCTSDGGDIEGTSSITTATVSTSTDAEEDESEKDPDSKPATGPSSKTTTAPAIAKTTKKPTGEEITKPDILPGSTTTTTTTAKAPGKTYVGFVVDDTGSMSKEILAVKQWIQDCVAGTNPNCGQEPTGGWIITSFNDPSTGRVVGPTMDTGAIIAEAGSYHAHGGEDCPEMAFAGLKNAATVVPDDNGGCKMYFFTDATAADPSEADAVTELHTKKNCKFVPILTGCCGPCPDACESVSEDYCIDHVTDSRASASSRRKRSTSGGIQTLFYTMSEETGGNIYVTDKPSSPDDLLDFLEEEVTLGFCASSEIAGPTPDGYKCEADCIAMNQCWDRSVSRCYCNTTCAHAPIPQGYSRCAGAQVVVCDPEVIEEIIPDQKNCTGFYRCYSGRMAYFNCAKGTVFSSESKSHCDHPKNVPPPCGTLGTVEAKHSS